MNELRIFGRWRTDEGMEPYIQDENPQLVPEPGLLETRRSAETVRDCVYPTPPH